MSELNWYEQVRRDARLKRERREAIRPLRAMLKGTSFGVRLPAAETGTVLITLGGYGWTREIAWKDCGDRALVARLQLELIDEADSWLDRATREVVQP